MTNSAEASVLMSPGARGVAPERTVEPADRRGSL